MLVLISRKCGDRVCKISCVTLSAALKAHEQRVDALGGLLANNH